MTAAPSKIRVLDSLVAERIAAGEVIERPSSVVKELVENALDAGATEILVALEDGGKQLIEIQDNGHGMNLDDLGICTLRHATSKIREVSDLEKLDTLGFRGEALPSIAAVGELAILTRAEGETTAREWKNGRIEEVTFGHFLGKPHGTRMQVRSLFSQIPARLKFLKSAGAEVSAVREWMERLALTHPQAGFKLVSDDRTILTLRPETEEARVKALLSDGNDYPLITHTVNDPSGITLRAHWLQGLSSPQTRKLVQVINRRAVRDRLVQQAMLSPFRQALLPGQFPAIALFLEIPPNQIDVNVHPTKTELRFLNSSALFRTIDHALDDMIARHGITGFAAKPSFFHADQHTDWNAASPSRNESGAPGAGASSFSRGSAWSTPSPAPSTGEWRTLLEPSPPQNSDLMETGTGTQAPAQSASPLFAEETHPFNADRFSGMIFRTYLLYDLGEELALIDQHAAHERIRYEKLKERAFSRAESGENQQLLLSEIVKFPPERRGDVEMRLPLLARMGFEAELFGDREVLFRSLPTAWGSEGITQRLGNLVERLLESDIGKREAELVLDERLFEKLASEACHSSVRAGDRLNVTQAQSLVDALFACEHPWNCPHGRPTVARVPRARFEEWFHRRV